MRQVREFRVAEVLRTTFAVYGQNLRCLVLLVLITFAPLLVLMAFNPPPDPPDLPLPTQDPEQSREVMAAFLPAWKDFYLSFAWYWMALSLCAFWLQGAVAYVVVRALRSNPPTLRQALWQSWRAIPCVFVVALLMTLAIAFAALLFLVPGIIVALMLWVAIPAAVVERRYGSALRRSYDLTLGHKGPLFGLMILLFIFQTACTLVLPAIATDLAPRFAPLIEAVVTAATGSVSAVVYAVCYHDLRALKEGGGSSAVARVFE